jgi:hypothetical protein
MKKIFSILAAVLVSFSAHADLKFLKDQNLRNEEFMTSTYELRLQNAIKKAFAKSGINPEAETMEEVQHFFRTGREDQFRYLQIFSKIRLDINDHYIYYNVVSRIEFTGNSVNDQDITVDILVE